ncbi:MAG: hypothetical protein JG782_94 [Anaerophaga sp.]|nr:hypothetical protein [Anaerophaga sp.]MDK2841392.1 hypothetical protein [Anaerophaga sp.]MDN5292601.1 hypothetical protein [Anaerophaga sp.]
MNGTNHNSLIIKTLRHCVSAFRLFKIDYLLYRQHDLEHSHYPKYMPTNWWFDLFFEFLQRQ